jgi:hypothetical protein
MAGRQLIYDLQSVGQSVLVSGAHLGPVTNFFFLLDISFIQLRVCKLLYSCFWAMPALSLLGRSPSELTALFNCLIWDSTNLEGQVPAFRSHVVQCELSSITVGRAAWEACSATWNLGTNSAFALGPRKTTENLWLVNLYILFGFLFEPEDTDDILLW